MMSPPSQTRHTATLLVWTVLIMLSVFHFVRSAGATRFYGFVDFPIFLAQAETFLETGELYVDSSDPATYAPSAAVYKFPPFYAALILPLVIDGVQTSDLLFHWWIQLLLYGLACGLLLFGFWRKSGSRFLPLAGILVLNFEPFFETLWRLQIETPILLLLAIATLAVMRRPGVWAGVTIALGFMLKLYPVFLLLYLAIARRFMALVWFGVSVVLVLVGTLIVIGPAEHATFCFEILPRLIEEQPSGSTENLSLARYVQLATGVSAIVAKRLAQLVAFGLIAVTLVVLRRAVTRPKNRLAAATSFALFIPLMLLSMPNSWVNYQLLLLIPLVVLASHCLRAPRGGRGVLWAVLIAAYLPLLFYAPCAAPSVPWPCAQTPYFLGLWQLPRPLHDLMVGTRVLSPLLLWGGLLRAWHRA